MGLLALAFDEADGGLGGGPVDMLIVMQAFGRGLSWSRISATVALAVIAAVNAVIALYYYARVIKTVWLDDPAGEFPGDPTRAPAGSLRLALGVSVALTIAIGFYPTITTFVGEASRVIAVGG